MATYISFIKLSQQGIQNIKDSPNRLDAVRKLFRDKGGELKAFYLTMGRYDAVVIAEMPKLEDLANIMLLYGKMGAGSTETVPAFPEAEYRTIVGALP